MLLIKTNPAGVDFYIQQLQTKLHAAMIRETDVDDSKYKCYGRCYRNKREEGYIAENYEGNGEYKEVYWDDTLTAISFFGLSGTIKTGVNHEADVHLVMFANLIKLGLQDRQGNTIAHRADEELRALITSVIGNHSNGFNYISTELWIENVLREYQGSRREKRLVAVDMHPVHCFRVNLKLIFNPNKVC